MYTILSLPAILKCRPVTYSNVIAYHIKVQTSDVQYSVIACHINLQTAWRTVFCLFPPYYCAHHVHSILSLAVMLMWIPPVRCSVFVHHINVRNTCSVFWNCPPYFCAHHVYSILSLPTILMCRTRFHYSVIAHHINVQTSCLSNLGPETSYPDHFLCFVRCSWP